ncbi:MAG: hypothetical protein ACRDE2_14590, partial [Chitinophagaceae bacterium]
MKKIYLLYLLCLFGFLFPIETLAQSAVGISGSWQLIPDESAPLSYYNTLNLKIAVNNSHITFVKKWVAQFPKTDSVDVPTENIITRIPVTNRIWPYQVFMGVSMIPGSEKEIKAKWITKDSVLQIDETYPILISQGREIMHSINTYSLSDNGQKLTLNIRNNFLNSQS